MEQHSVPKVETPEFAIPDHAVVLHLSSPTAIELTIDGRIDSRIRAPGDLTLFPAGALRKIRASQRHKVLIVALSPAFLSRAASMDGNFTNIELAAQPILHDPQLEHIAMAFKSEAESNYQSGPLYGEGLAFALAAHVLKSYSTTSQDLSARKGGIAPQALRRVMDFIQENLSNPLHLDSLAGIAGLSEYRFAHNFKAATGISPHQYVIRARIERSKQLLRATDLSILQIAHVVGCQSPSRFTSLFQRETGVLPSRYRAFYR